ncbi:hypothetical protein MPDQ_000700 [Monascus purpureus]|uniref:DUF2961 domain-containing protein n=1 Tax=Monascus purpureus TaxID=5098 RepID=A0A507QRI9_MONPU|nr:hypothetical protein MPDQ_000700 [Monascus purpureus]BDD62103.1 hypothetical protein MAP00_007095 [Monascus purpureus]
MSGILDGDLFSAVAERKMVRSTRVSSWDHTGNNNDHFVIQPGETAVLADLEGPGKITHLWFVQACRRMLGPGLVNYAKAGSFMSETPGTSGLSYEDNDPDYYRKVLIKMYWDDSETPNVLAPLGDFFCIGHSLTSNFQSLPFTVSARPEDDKKFGGAAALNCYLPMPFNKRARIEVENQGENSLIQYFYIDYELRLKPFDPSKILYFHAHWRRENPTQGWAPPEMQTNSPETNVPNLDGKDNYVLLDTTGAGTYIGCNHSVAHFQGSWWGEGDDMIFIDDDTWPPSIHGTGGEDYFCMGWGMQKNAYPFCGSILHESEVPNYQVSYRWHLPDPVRFNKKIRVTMEHGHANHLSDDWSTTVYWYQTLPGPKLDILPVQQRLPRKPQFPPYDTTMDAPKPKELTELQKKMIVQREERFREFLKDHNELLEAKAVESRERAKKNIELAREVRRRFLAGTWN